MTVLRKERANHPMTTELNGVEFLSLFRSSLDLFSANIPTINDLNVFPKPDGDTGTNMFMTLRDIVNKSAPLASESVADTSRIMAREAVEAGRGNSGILLAAFFEGMAEALESSPRFGGEELTRSLATASRYAYEGIGHPKEGTILTVMRESAEAAESAAERDLSALMTTVCDAAMDSVVRTPLLLSVLWDAGLVDSGGYGFYVMLEGIRRRLHRAADVIETLQAPQAPDRDGGISPEFLDVIDEDESGFCTQFLVRGEGIDKEAVKARLMEFGTSPVVIGSSDAVRIHVHTDEPQRALDLGHSLGEVSDEKIDDMDKQREFFSADHRAELSADHVTPIAVVQGKGLKDVFKGEKVKCIKGGDTMNPSVGDLLDAMENAPTNAVAFLPNNSNIIGAANKAAKISSKDVRVVPSRTVVQGIAAALEVHESASLGELVDNMTRRIDEVKTGEICSASRDAELGGVAIAEGQLIAMLDQEIVFASDSVEDALTGLIERAATDAATDDAEIERVDLYWGELLEEREAKDLLAAAEERFPEIDEFVLIPGDQPHYHLFVFIE